MMCWLDRWLKKRIGNIPMLIDEFILNYSNIISIFLLMLLAFSLIMLAYIGTLEMLKELG